ncbi:ring canal kelch homolog isoform X1 [Ruditapes philippinarum]|uniref:ring canal kelch homolog isoform X1 n=1 Tax=Ruditapes philippinarum TaxID=129788 RepID=UPI00295B5363|nr:ring canal kelch homolog isoform X1 [Ruditapes philippinarum]
MIYDAGKTKPESNRKRLVQQVNNQSNLCDVTVKMGLWEKKFHRCILVISPFFDHVLNDNFLERQTGIIEIAMGTPATLETTIMFLYGKKPKLNDENIENILHMAEFLLIPNLKSACIAWLKTVSVTRENCMKFLQLSSIYDFELPRCTTYIEEHLPEMLLLPQMINLTKDSILLLFSDTRLSYVQMDDRLLFLLKWLDANPNTRKAHMKELLSNIDFHSISNQCLQEALNNSDVACHIQSECMTTVGSNDRRVLIMKEGNYGDSFWCLDLERDQWFRVKSNSLKEDRSGGTVEISGTFTKTTGSLVCSVRSYPETSFMLLDLPKDACTKMNFTANEDDFSIKQPENIKVYGHVCIVSVNKEIKKMQNLYEDSSFGDIHQRLRIMSLLGLASYDQLVAQHMIDNRLSTSRYIAISTLYIGHIGDSNVDMLPLFSIKDDEIRKFAISESAIAFILKSQKYVSLYDVNEGHLERKKTNDQLQR